MKTKTFCYLVATILFSSCLSTKPVGPAPIVITNDKQICSAIYMGYKDIGFKLFDIVKNKYVTDYITGRNVRYMAEIECTDNVAVKIINVEGYNKSKNKWEPLGFGNTVYEKNKVLETIGKYYAAPVSDYNKMEIELFNDPRYIGLYLQKTNKPFIESWKEKYEIAGKIININGLEIISVNKKDGGFEVKGSIDNLNVRIITSNTSYTSLRSGEKITASGTITDVGYDLFNYLTLYIKD